MLFTLSSCLSVFVYIVLLLSCLVYMFLVLFGVVYVVLLLPSYVDIALLMVGFLGVVFKAVVIAVCRCCQVLFTCFRVVQLCLQFPMLALFWLRCSCCPVLVYMFLLPLVSCTLYDVFMTLFCHCLLVVELC